MDNRFAGLGWILRFRCKIQTASRRSRRQFV